MEPNGNPQGAFFILLFFFAAATEDVIPLPVTQTTSANKVVTEDSLCQKLLEKLKNIFSPSREEVKHPPGGHPLTTSKPSRDLELLEKLFWSAEESQIYHHQPEKAKPEETQTLHNNLPNAMLRKSDGKGNNGVHQTTKSTKATITPTTKITPITTKTINTTSMSNITKSINKTRPTTTKATPIRQARPTTTKTTRIPKMKPTPTTTTRTTKTRPSPTKATCTTKTKPTTTKRPRITKMRPTPTKTTRVTKTRPTTTKSTPTTKMNLAATLKLKSRAPTKLPPTANALGRSAHITNANADFGNKIIFDGNRGDKIIKTTRRPNQNGTTPNKPHTPRPSTNEQCQPINVQYNFNCLPVPNGTLHDLQEKVLKIMNKTIQDIMEEIRVAIKK
ncbi:uncharacterized protein LOC143998186 [Lithobates pipiens]